MAARSRTVPQHEVTTSEYAHHLEDRQMDRGFRLRDYEQHEQERRVASLFVGRLLSFLHFFSPKFLSGFRIPQ